MKRKLSLLLCLILILVTAAGCTQENEPQPPAEDKPPVEDITDETKIKMEPGTYTAQAYGFSMSWPDILNVTVSEDAIVSIAFDEESGSTASMIDS